MLGGDHHRRARALQDVAVGADEDHVAGAVPLGVPQRGHVHRVGQGLRAGQQPRHVGRASAGSPRASVKRRHARCASVGHPRGQLRRSSRRRCMMSPAQRLRSDDRSPVPGCTPAAARPRRRRRRSTLDAAVATAARHRGRSGAGRSIIRADCVSRARCASSRHGLPSRTSSDSKMPSPRTAARSSACSNGAAGSCSSPSSVTTTLGTRFARHGQEA